MNALAELRRRFAAALTGLTDDVAELVDLVKPSQDPKFGDYQANCAMPLGKRLGRPPRDVAQDIVGRLECSDLCAPPEIAGPGFINLRLHDDWIARQLAAALADPRLGVAPVQRPRTYVVDYSAPNVAKPMHVGHIRSTVIGDGLYRTLRFLGHRTIGDNHVGDWGTQFGMIIYGYRWFVDRAAFEAEPVAELARLYRLVNRLVDYHDSRRQLPELRTRLAERKAALATAPPVAQAPPADKEAAKAHKEALKERRKLEAACAALAEETAAVEAKLAGIDNDPALSKQAAEHANIGQAVLQETAKLHHGDEENLRLWRQFVPACMEDIERIYRRLGVTFDHTLGESFYHEMLPVVVDDLCRRGLAQESNGALCVFLEGLPAPMIVRKQDGAFLYATTDLATIRYRMEHWRPDAMLYVVDHRQGLHFEQLFAVARRWGYEDVELAHVSFGTVLGDDGRPFKTRSGDTVGLSGLLDEAVRRAHAIVSANDDAKPAGAELSADQRQAVAERVGIAALKYADLSQNRTSDYVFSYDKMLAMTGNTATYMQYAYARVRSIFAKGGVDADGLRAGGAVLSLTEPAERSLGLELLRFEAALEQVVAEYRPHYLTTYLFELANQFSVFFEQCPVLRAPSEETRHSRLLLCDLTARTLRQGLELLGIEVVERM